MKGDPEVVQVLNDLLSDELTAINTYMVHSEMCDNWGYARQHKIIERRAVDEMRHAETLIGRILFLEGMPVVARLGPIHIGESIPKQLEGDRESEQRAIGMYNAAIRLAGAKGDSGTRELLEHILRDEEDHIDFLESQLDQIRQAGVAPWLAEQIRE